MREPTYSGVGRTITYVLAAERYDGWVKIGKTDAHSPDSRRNMCQTGNPRRLHIVCFWGGDVEHVLHGLYAPLRGCGEWFAFPPAAVAFMGHHREDLKGWARLAAEWPPKRILALGEGMTPDEMADSFAYRTAHAEPTRRLKSA